MKKIMVTKSSLPPFEEYINEIKDIWQTHWLTNRECIIVCVKAKFVDTVRARSGHPIGGFIPTWQNAK